MIHLAVDVFSVDPTEPLQPPPCGELLGPPRLISADFRYKKKNAHLSNVLITTFLFRMVATPKHSTVHHSSFQSSSTNEPATHTQKGTTKSVKSHHKNEQERNDEFRARIALIFGKSHVVRRALYRVRLLEPEPALLATLLAARYVHPPSDRNYGVEAASTLAPPGRSGPENTSYRVVRGCAYQQRSDAGLWAIMPT